jgi:hypothetical protein
MEYKDVVALYFERSNQMLTFWTFYLAVCLALPVIVGLMRPSTKRLIVAAVLSFAFTVIAAVNLTAVIDISRARLTCRNLIFSSTLENLPVQIVQEQINKMITPPSIASVVSVELGGDLAVLGVLWYLALARQTSVP